MTIAPPSPGSVAEVLNRSARRIFHAGQQQEWSAAVVDAALAFSEAAALFTVQGSRLKLERASFEAPAGLSLEPSAAPAVAQALESLEPVVAAWSPRELSPQLVAAFDALAVGRVFLFPLVAARRSIGLLVAVDADPNGLELLCSIAAAAWQLRRARNASAAGASTGLIALAPAAAAAAEGGEDGEWHQRARRFASVRVAELRLYQAAKVKAAREAGNLYEMFQKEIDHERVVFRTQFMEKSASMADYLHEELVRTLAQGEADRLGEKYPGAMVHR